MDAAAALYVAVLNADPLQFDALHSLGVIALQQGRPADAKNFLIKAISVRQDSTDAFYNLGIAFDTLGQYEDAVASYDTALRLRPAYARAFCNRGNSLKKMNLVSEARQSFETALALTPDYPVARLGFGLVALLQGDFAAGWPAYESRWQSADAGVRRYAGPAPVWRGEDISGRRIVVYEEQGLGDVIMFSRYLRLLDERGAHVTFVVRASMHRLLQPLARFANLVDRPAPQAEFDFQCALMSLPGVLGIGLKTIPSSPSYLQADSVLSASWKQRLGPTGFKIGVCWQGNPQGSIDQGRSFALQSLAGVAALPGARLISLQMTHGLDQIAALPAGLKVETLGDDFDTGPDAFLDSAAVMANLDLVITCDTSIAHLAGALGVPVWVALKHVPDWRWMLERTDSPWYPSMKLYRQTARGDWAGVFARIARDVDELTRQARD